MRSRRWLSSGFFYVLVAGALLAQGDAQGTPPVMLTFFEDAISLGPFLTFSGATYFGVSTMSDGAASTALYRTDGTPDNTIPIWQASSMHECTPLARGPSLLYFAAYHSSSVFGDIWCTDGTAAGCRYVGTFRSNYEWGTGQGTVATLGDSLYFRAPQDDSLYAPTALWRTDGTPESTLILQTFEEAAWMLSPSQPLPIPRCLTPLGDKMLFAAYDSEHGDELWITDGTPEGTRMLADLRHSQGYYRPGTAFVLDGKFFVSTDDGIHGYQVWAMTPAAGIENNGEPCARGGLYETGDSIRLCVPEGSAWAIQWYHDGIPLPGQVYQSLHLFNLQPQDSGRYTAIYDDGTKTPGQYEVNITVAEDVPASGPVAVACLIAFIAACSLFRRRAEKVANFPL